MKVGLALYPGCIPSGLFAASDLLEAANQISGQRCFEICWVGDKSTLQAGVSSNTSALLPSQLLKPHQDIAQAELQAILLPGMWIKSVEDLERNIAENESLIRALMNLSPKVHIHSYCSSVSFLALTGRLDRQAATSTWWLADFYQKNLC